MADLTVEVNVTTPSSIDVPLVRGDHLRTSNVFRIVFEVSLALFAAGLGAVFGGEELGSFGKAYLGSTGLAALVFLVLAFWWRRRAILDSYSAGPEG